MEMLSAEHFSGSVPTPLWDLPQSRFWSALEQLEAYEDELLPAWPFTADIAAAVAGLFNRLMTVRSPAVRDVRAVATWAALTNRMPLRTACAIQRHFAAAGAVDWPREAYAWSARHPEDFDAALFRLRADTYRCWQMIADAMDHLQKREREESPRTASEDN